MPKSARLQVNLQVRFHSGGGSPVIKQHLSLKTSRLQSSRSLFKALGESPDGPQSPEVAGESPDGPRSPNQWAARRLSPPHHHEHSEALVLRSQGFFPTTEALGHGGHR